MIIKDHYENIEVFAVYWLDEKTYFYGFSKGYDGLLAYNADDVNIVDPVMSGDFIYFDGGVFFKPLIEEKLLDDLVDADPIAYKRFLEILAARN